jgi:hypothetical protein
MMMKEYKEKDKYSTKNNKMHPAEVFLAAINQRSAAKSSAMNFRLTDVSV